MDNIDWDASGVELVPRGDDGTAIPRVRLIARGKELERMILNGDREGGNEKY